jgi:hypothetical protein
MGRVQENKKGARWAWFKGEKENDLGSDLSTENSFLF